VLKYGPNNNFHLFKEALSKASLKLYGPLGKLNKTGEVYTPDIPEAEDYDLDDDPYGVNKATYLEDIKKHRKELLKIKQETPKLYGLILQYLSEESLDEINRKEDFDDIDQKTDAVRLWALVEETHRVNSISKVEAITKMAARTAYQSIRQGSYESIITYKERFNSALKSYKDSGNPQNQWNYQNH